LRAAVFWIVSHCEYNLIGPLGAPSARNVERDDDHIAGTQIGDLRADRLDDPHGLVAEYVALVHHRPQLGVPMKVGTTDGGRRDPHHRVGGFHDSRLRGRTTAIGEDFSGWT
jgi:hypothetical protein